MFTISEQLRRYRDVITQGKVNVVCVCVSKHFELKIQGLIYNLSKLGPVSTILNVFPTFPESENSSK